MRIGELLVRAGLLTVEQVEEVLRAQVMWGGRFGTNAVELGFIMELDELAVVIGQRHQLPAALLKHFRAADSELQRLLSPELAVQYGCVPLRRVGSERVAISSIAPLDGKARALVADQLGISYKGLIPAVAPELRIHWQLEHVYGIPRETRFLRARTRSRMPSFDTGIVDVEEVVDVEDLPSQPLEIPYEPPTDGVPEEQLPELTPRNETAEQPASDERRHYIRMLDESQPIARIDVRRAAEPNKSVDTLADATRAIRRAPHRDAIGKHVIEAIERFAGVDAAVLLVIRGNAATAWAGYRQSGEPLLQIAVPIDQPSIVASALRTKQISRGSVGEPMDVLLLEALGVEKGELVAVPIALGEHVWCVIALATERELDIEPVAAIGNAAAAAFARLLRNANR